MASVSVGQSLPLLRNSRSHHKRNPLSWVLRFYFTSSGFWFFSFSSASSRRDTASASVLCVFLRFLQLQMAASSLLRSTVPAPLIEASSSPSDRFSKVWSPPPESFSRALVFCKKNLFTSILGLPCFVLIRNVTFGCREILRGEGCIDFEYYGFETKKKKLFLKMDFITRNKSTKIIDQSWISLLYLSI